jgi:hypothetical protein
MFFVSAEEWKRGNRKIHELRKCCEELRFVAKKLNSIISNFAEAGK